MENDGGNMTAQASAARKFGWSLEQAEALGARWTATEIAQQPRIWPAIEALVGGDESPARRFVLPLFARSDLRIVLTGAGTSAFVGQCLAPALRGSAGRQAAAIATTDLVAAPRHCLEPDAPTLLVSFARSGTSPESVAALELAQQCLTECHHLVITCNADGALSRRAASMRNAVVVQLPDEVNDRSFAMTSSFSSMLLAGALAFGLMRRRADGTPAAQAISPAAQYVLEHLLSALSELAREGFARVVFLGAKELKALAREAALKMLELTDGRVVAVSDTPLGFRHGPKTILQERTLVVLLRSNDAYTSRYDDDLLRELRAEAVAARVLALGPPRRGAGAADGNADELVLPGTGGCSDLELCFPYVVFAQTLAMLQAVALGRRPDQPNESGTVNRVVRGVTIHPLPGKVA